MEVPSLPQDSNQRVQEWLSSTSNPLRLLPHLPAHNHPLLPSPPPSDTTPRKRKFDDAFPTNNTIPMPRPTRSEAGSQSNVTELTEKTNFTVNAKQKGGSRSPSPARKLLRLLEEAEPPLRCYQQGTVELPPSALELLRTLSRNLWKGVIPSCFQVSLRLP
ncbi:hypothetical protein DM02DRAFT_412112 [Periconia macrospinosa]|uniref:Uncharacterized protein n=1 Tax=Periconia macrospinosa TaxID=97972 RepID=A0A2V1D0I7_9PLEO|nr:hypothetical protein DM02DRAFT_412112 [Periconia macrospinosa]